MYVSAEFWELVIPTRARRGVTLIEYTAPLIPVRPPETRAREGQVIPLATIPVMKDAAALQVIRRYVFVIAVDLHTTY